MNMLKQERIAVKYHLQHDLYNKLGRLSEPMSTEYNTSVMEHIWTLNIKELRLALK